MADKVLLVDGPNLAMRAIFAAGRTGLSTVDGVPTGPLLIFINTLSRYVREERFSGVVVCWEGGISQRRAALFPAYKAHRAQATDDALAAKDTHFSRIKQFCALAGLEQAIVPGCEADDVIASYWWNARDAQTRVVILSSDKDFLGLVDNGTEQIRVSSSMTATDRWDAARVRQTYGCEPQDFYGVLALAGDPSDGVPGVPGIGPKKAVKILAEVDWDFDRLKTHPKIAPHWDAAWLSYQLVTLCDQNVYAYVPVPEIPEFKPTDIGNPGWEDLLGFLDAFEMETVKNRLRAGTLWQNFGARVALDTDSSYQ